MKLILFRNLINSIKDYFYNQKPLCFIEEINFHEKNVIIHSRGISSPLKFNFDEIIQDLVIISNLPPEQASWIGYYYGLHYLEILKYKVMPSKNVNSSFEFNACATKSKYKVLFQNRDGSISYLERTTNIIIQKPILYILTEQHLIKNFDPIESCYLGLLGAIHVSKQDRKKTSKARKSSASLRLVT